MAETFESARKFLLKWVLSGTSTVTGFQKMCGVSTDFSNGEKKVTISNPFFYYYFMTAAAAGNELFYIIALPSLFWLVDFPLSRRLIVVWVIVYFIGQSIKDICRLPRPPSPPVTRLETHYETEYGFPSTHAMVSFVLPFYSLYVWTLLDYEIDFYFGLAFCALWCTSITLSRLYVGVHSVCDLSGGLLLGFLVVFLGILIGEAADKFMVESVFAPPAYILLSILLIWSYPAPLVWTNAYGDTSLIIAVGAGVSTACSCWFPTMQSFNWAANTAAARLRRAASLDGADANFTLLDEVQIQCGAALFVLLRLIVGCSVLFLTRSLVKKASHAIWLPLVLPKYFAYCSIFHRNCPTMDSPRDDASTPAVSPSPKNNAAKDYQNCDKEESTLRSRVPSSHTTSQDAVTPSSSTGIVTPKPIRVIRPVPPQQFRLSSSPALGAAPLHLHGTKLSTKDFITPTGSPLATLLTSSPRLPSTPHKMLPHPDNPKTVLVEFDVAGTSVVINPLEVYLVEIPIKYVTYFAVGFNACCTVPFIFRLLGI